MCLIGLHNVPLLYVIHGTVVMVAPLPVLKANNCYSEEHGSIVCEMVACTLHGHTSSEEDNISAFEEATHGTSYAASLKPCQ